MIATIEIPHLHLQSCASPLSNQACACKPTVIPIPGMRSEGLIFVYLHLGLCNPA